MQIDRRAFFQLLPWQAAALTWLVPRIARGADAPSFDDVARKIEAMARAVRDADEPDEDAYLVAIGEQLGRVAGIAPGELGEPFLGLIRTSIRHRGGGVALIEWSLEPETTYPAHDHPSYNGVTFGLEGRCRMCNFQVEGSAPARDSKATFRVRKTQDAMLRPRLLASHMTTTESNIHMLRTGKVGARGLDVSTLMGDSIRFAFVDIEPGRSSDGTFAARWRPR